MRNLAAATIVGICIIVGAIGGGLVSHDPVAAARAIGWGVKGKEREEWTKKLVYLLASFETGISYGSLGDRIADVNGAATLVVLKEHLESESNFSKSSREIVRSLQRIKVVWDDKFENMQYARCLDLARGAYGKGLTADMCTRAITNALDAEGVEYDKDRLISGKYGIDELVSLMISSSAKRISLAVAIND